MIRADNFKTGNITDEYADFRVVECSNCQCRYIHDFEHCVLYYTSKNLKVSFLTLFEEDEMEQYPLPCRQCKKLDWEFRDINFFKKARVLKGEWGWAL